MQTDRCRSWRMKAGVVLIAVELIVQVKKR